MVSMMKNLLNCMMHIDVMEQSLLLRRFYPIDIFASRARDRDRWWGIISSVFIYTSFYIRHIGQSHQVCVDEPILLPNTILAIVNLAFYCAEMSSLKCRKH